MVSWAGSTAYATAKSPVWQSHGRYCAACPAASGANTSVSNRSRSTLPPGSAKRSGVRCSGRRKKSSMCSTLPPKRLLSIAANVVLPDVHGPSIATNTQSRSASNVSIRAIAMLASVGFAGFVTIAFAVNRVRSDGTRANRCQVPRRIRGCVRRGARRCVR